jgi:hypothetical protein
MISSSLTDASRIYRQQFAVISAVVIVVWLPCELLSTYLDAFVFLPDDFQSSFNVAKILDCVCGIIAVAGVTVITLNAESVPRTSFGAAMGLGLDAWGRLLWTHFVAGFVVLLSFLLLIIPGFYVLTQLCFLDAVVVAERHSGMRAVYRTFALTDGRFWMTFRFAAVALFLKFLPMAAIIFPMSVLAAFLPAFDHWLIRAGTQLVSDILAAFSTVVVVCGYRAYVSSFVAPQPRVEITRDISAEGANFKAPQN